MKSFDAQLCPWTSLPKYLQEVHYQNPTDPSRTAFQLGHGTMLTPEPWAKEHPGVLQSLGRWMAVQRQGEPSWLDVFPKERLMQLAKSSSPTPLFIDVAGGLGDQCLAVRAFCAISSRGIVLQDLAPLIEAASAAREAGIECIAHDMWTGQPQKGAAIIYMRNVLHDYPDARAVELLRLQMQAMEDSSILVVDEIVMPQSGVHWHAADLDMAMMASLAARERTAELWQRLFAQAGLAMQESFPYSKMGHTAMILAICTASE